MNEQSIEFGSFEDPVTPKIIRKSFRIPVNASQEAIILIKDNVYKIADISMDGISFYLEAESDFTIDEKLKGCELKIQDITVKGLEGTIVHFTQEDGKKGKYGIKWVNLKNINLKQIKKCFLEIKTAYFSKTGSDSDMIE